MQPEFDMEQAADALARVVGGITEAQLDEPTPCSDFTVRQLLAHTSDAVDALRRLAAREQVSAPSKELPADWRDLIPTQLKGLVIAWREPAAWDGDVEVFGGTRPASAWARIALDELVVHGWDLAVATGQQFDCAPSDLEVLQGWWQNVPAEGMPGMFAPAVPVPDDASALDRVIARSGRSPSWQA
ncbi:MULTISPECIES: TIGR03086 family metal-binding protein [unclassified Nocardia]|uniref:TIGR03086 family metal-binding protein n=1 Tax=unclassified Nocardia TaxID=2637762 RepID=UPI001CE47F4F|nr:MULTISPECIES: TIGR03086 family metal-binding protein [unclassified Nocardia]